MSENKIGTEIVKLETKINLISPYDFKSFMSTRFDIKEKIETKGIKWIL